MAYASIMTTDERLPDARSEDDSSHDPPPRSTLIDIIFVIIKVFPLMIAFILITWAITKYGERSSEEIDRQCRDRSQQSIGFKGDADFYGLGIRLGIYLQWASAFLTNWFTPFEREPFTVTYFVFSISLTIAVIARVFSQQCTFAAEMFVVLTMFWGGLNVILLMPMLRGIMVDRNLEVPLEVRGKIYNKLKTSQGLIWTSSLLNVFMSPVTIWYWVRIAKVGQRDFASTPGLTTSLFFFARIYGHGIKVLSIFMATASGINLLWFTWLLFPLKHDSTFKDKRLEARLGGIIWLLLNLSFFPLSIAYETISKAMMVPMAYVTFGLNLVVSCIGMARAYYRFANHTRAKPRLQAVQEAYYFLDNHTEMTPERLQDVLSNQKALKFIR